MGKYKREILIAISAVAIGLFIGILLGENFVKKMDINILNKTSTKNSAYVFQSKDLTIVCSKDRPLTEVEKQTLEKFGYIFSSCTIGVRPEIDTLLLSTLDEGLTVVAEFNLKLLDSVHSERKMLDPKNDQQKEKKEQKDKQPSPSRPKLKPKFL